MNVEHTRVKSVFLHLASFIGVYTIVIANLYVVLTGIDLLYPDIANDYYYSYENAVSTLRFAASSLIVALPITLVIYKFIRRDEAVLNENHWIVKSLGYLTMITIVVTIAGRLIFQINAILGGEILPRSLWKTLAIIVILGITFFHYWGSIAKKEWYTLKTQRCIRWTTIIGTVICLVIGIWAAGSPVAAREHKIDQKRVNDLVTIQNALERTVLIDFEGSQKQKAPATLQELLAATQYFRLQMDIDSYAYTKISDTEVKVCTNFLQPAQKRYMPSYNNLVFYSHPEGNVCYIYTAQEQGSLVLVRQL